MLSDGRLYPEFPLYCEPPREELSYKRCDGAAGEE